MRTVGLAEPSAVTRALSALLAAVVAGFRGPAYLAIENAALRQQLAVFKQKRRRPPLSSGDRVFWILLRRVWPSWRNALVFVQPDTVVRWHRRGFRLFWAWKSRRRSPGRPRVDLEVRQLIRRMANDNGWGAPRIHGELHKLGFDVSERTVSRYMPRRTGKPDQVDRWKAFLRNHRESIAAMEFFSVPTITFNVLYVLVVIDHARRRIIHFNVTRTPGSTWIAQQLRDAFPFDQGPSYLIYDHDAKFSAAIDRLVESFGAKPTRTPVRSLWQNGLCGRWIGAVRRELLDRVVPFGERHLRGLLRSYIEYLHEDRTHLGLGKDCPLPRPIESRPGDDAKVVALPRVGGLHHRYRWRKAA